MTKKQKKSIPVIYEVKIKGHLDEQWADWFEGMTFTHESDSTTTLCGPVVDQAALYGLLIKMRDLDLPLLSVNRIKPKPIEPKPTDCFPSP